jgi:hypothetical protein
MACIFEVYFVNGGVPDVANITPSLLAYHVIAKFDRNCQPRIARWYFCPGRPAFNMSNQEKLMDQAGVWAQQPWTVDGTHRKLRVHPPYFVKLPGPHISEMVTGLVSTNIRGVLWNSEFGMNGEVRDARFNSGPAVICWLRGVPWVAVYRSCYLLTGDVGKWGRHYKLRDGTSTT